MCVRLQAAQRPRIIVGDEVETLLLCFSEHVRQIGRFLAGDYTGALEMSELILTEEADNLEAAECGENCRSVLEQMYAARLGPLDRVPMVVVPRTQMRWLSMDHRAGFILSLIDGASSVDLILDVCGMPKLDALRILQELVQQKIVAFR